MEAGLWLFTIHVPVNRYYSSLYSSAVPTTKFLLKTLDRLECYPGCRVAPALRLLVETIGALPSYGKIRHAAAAAGQVSTACRQKRARVASLFTRDDAQGAGV